MDLTANQLLMRGFRPIYTDVWQTYNLNQHLCQAPAALPDKFPEQGIDLRAFKEGSPVRLQWSAYTSPDNKDVSEDLKDDISELLDIIDRVDKDKDFMLTNSEWVTAHKNAKPEDELFDREYVLLAKGIFDFQGLPVNPNLVNPEKYPELIVARNEMKVKEDQNVTLQKERDDARKDASNWQNLTYGLGAVLGVSAFALAIRAALRKRKPIHPDAKVAIARDQIPDPGIPPPAAQANQPTAARIIAPPSPPPLPSSGYGDVLSALGNQTAAPDNVLAALEEAEQEAAAEAEAAQALENPPPPPAVPIT